MADVSDKTTDPAAGSANPPEQMMRDAAYERVEALLNTGRLKPGQLVSQRELVSMTDTTLGSIREAISRLQSEGLLVSLPKRGLMVPSMDVRFVREAYELRKVLELSAVEPATKHLGPTVLDQWILQLESVRHSAADQNQEQADELQKLDWSMHTALIKAMQNGLILDVYRVNSIKIRMAVQFRLRVTPFNAQRIVSEHLAFLRPMRDGDVQAARQALWQHIENSLTLALGGTLG